MRNDFPSMDFKLPRIRAGVIKIIIVVVVVILILSGSIYQVSPEQIGVILQLGKFVRTTDPGLHVKLPLGIEKVIKVPVQRQLKQEFGFRTLKPGIRTEYFVSPEAEKEKVMLTGDLNVVLVEWTVHYRIRDAYKYLFKVRNAEETFRYMNEAVVRKIVGDNSVDEVITVGRARIENQAKEELQQLCNLYEIGIDVNMIKFQDVNPPDEVKPSFNEVNESLQEKERMINEAWSDYNKDIPRAIGEAEQTIRAAEGYATERINKAKGDADRFIAVHREYSRAPLVTRRRLYLEALNEILPKLKRKIIFDEKQRNILPFLDLGEEVKK